MKESITWVGLDAHKKVHEVAVLVGEEETAERYSLNNDERTIRRFVKKVVKRREGQPDWVIRIAKKAHKRLNARYWKLTSRGKHPNVVVTSIARELAGFIWSVLHAQAEVGSADKAAD